MRNPNNITSSSEEQPQKWAFAARIAERLSGGRIGQAVGKLVFAQERPVPVRPESFVSAATVQAETPLQPIKYISRQRAQLRFERPSELRRRDDAFMRAYPGATAYDRAEHAYTGRVPQRLRADNTVYGAPYGAQEAPAGLVETHVTAQLPEIHQATEDRASDRTLFHGDVVAVSAHSNAVPVPSHPTAVPQGPIKLAL
jgi:hypothetical protein